jgi:hypothetical protein
MLWPLLKHTDFINKGNPMKCISTLLLSFFAMISIANAAQLYTLMPGQSMQLSDGSQVLCQGGNYTPAPPAANPHTACSVRFNPPASSCMAYVIYDGSREVVSPCLANLDQVASQIHSLMQIGICSRPMPSVCTTKFNPPASSCMAYVINNEAGNAISECLANVDQVKNALRKLQDIGICAFN